MRKCLWKYIFKPNRRLVAVHATDQKSVGIAWEFPVIFRAVYRLWKPRNPLPKTQVFRNAETPLVIPYKPNANLMGFHEKYQKSNSTAWEFPVGLRAVFGLWKTKITHCKTWVFRYAKTHQKTLSQNQWKTAGIPCK